MVMVSPDLVSAPAPVTVPPDPAPDPPSELTRPLNPPAPARGNLSFSTWAPEQLLFLQKQLNNLLIPPLFPPSSAANSHPKSYVSLFPPLAPPEPLPLQPPVWVDGKLTIRIPQQMINNSKESFSFSAIGPFAGRRPSLERVEHWIHASWRLSRPCLISLTDKGHFIFRFNSQEDRDSTVGQSPFPFDKKKLLLLPWTPGQSEDSWPAITPVWIRLRGLPFHCWSSDILMSIASTIGKPLRLDEITATQRILSFARILVNLDVATPCPKFISVDLEGDGMVEVEIQYDNIPCSECLSAGHLSDKCPFSIKSGILRKLPSAQLLPRDGVSATATWPEAVAAASPPSLSTFAKESV
ncbi:hypothetical protein MRB53_023842 [Persea americana]|uniref:Uncharacterized protein n=1 Tax=Persea americana TaxID=3435 RepID=A0ACC2LAK6_PERAE|nr:hypothetical protein MRB53_023842 [Persea americana]